MKKNKSKIPQQPEHTAQNQHTHETTRLNEDPDQTGTKIIDTLKNIDKAQHDNNENNKTNTPFNLNHNNGK